MYRFVTWLSITGNEVVNLRSDLLLMQIDSDLWLSSNNSTRCIDMCNSVPWRLDTSSYRYYHHLFNSFKHDNSFSYINSICYSNHPSMLINSDPWLSPINGTPGIWILYSNAYIFYYTSQILADISNMIVMCLFISRIVKSV